MLKDSFSLQEYEVRQYEASNWVSTSLKGIDYDQAQYTLFMRLFNYISGDNVKSKYHQQGQRTLSEKRYETLVSIRENTGE